MLTPSKIYAVKTNTAPVCKNTKNFRSGVITENSSSMNILRRSLLILFTTWLLMFAGYISWNNPPWGFFKTRQFYIFPFAFVGAGLILGWLGVMIIQHSKWIRSFYLLGLNASAIVLAVLILWMHAQVWARAWYAVTHPSARYTFYNHWGITGHTIARGFDRLCAAFPKPRQVHYLGCEITGRPVETSASDSIWTVYYCYRLYPDSTTMRFSRVEITRGAVQLMASNQLPAADSTFRRLIKEDLADKKEKIRTMIEIFSGRQEITGQDSLLRVMLHKDLQDTLPF